MNHLIYLNKTSSSQSFVEKSLFFFLNYTDQNQFLFQGKEQ